MTGLFLLLLRILFPLDPVARLREITRAYLGRITLWLEDPIRLADIGHDPWLRASLEADIAVMEHGLNLLIHERARQILGLPFLYTPRLKPPEFRRARPLGQLLARFSHLARLFDDLDRLAQRRATRMQRERERNPLGACPLRLPASPASTSPALRAEEESRQRLLNVQISSSSATHWGRWIGASSRRDGGGSLRARGPPSHHAIAHCRLPIA